MPRPRGLSGWVTTRGTEKPASTYKHDVDFKVHVEDPNHPVTHGIKDFAIHDETYGKIDGAWKITSWRLRYDRLDPLPREPLPKSILGGPDGLRDQAYISAVVNPRGS